MISLNFFITVSHDSKKDLNSSSPPPLFAMFSLENIPLVTSPLSVNEPNGFSFVAANVDLNVINSEPVVIAANGMAIFFRMDL